MTTTNRLLPRAMLLAGLLLMGQGLLVVLGILDHETPLLTSILLVIAGAGLLLWAARAMRAANPGAAEGDAPAAPERAGPWRLRRAHLVGALGAFAAGGVLFYNLRTGSDIILPEFAIIGYGVALLAAAPYLDRRVAGAKVGTLVAYSFPLVLAPLSLYALNAALEAQAGSTPLRLYIRYLLVAPMAAILNLSGLDVHTIEDTVRLATPRGALFLTVGVVCAGLYAGVIFLGVFGLFAWEARTPPMRLALYLALGLAGLHVANVVRLVLLGLVGYKWGTDALQSFHQHAGWVLFLLWAFVYWYLVLRRFEGPAAQGAGLR